MIKSLHLLTRFWSHISVRRRLELSLLLLVMLASSFAEVISIGMVVPFLSALTDPDLVFSNQFLQPIFFHFGIFAPVDIILPITAAFVTAVALSASIRLLLVALQVRLSAEIINELATKAYQNTLSQPYSTHISRNSSEVIAGIITKVSNGFGATLGGGLVIASSLLILFSILTALVIIEPIVAFSSIFIFGAAYALLLALTKKRLARESERISVASTKVVQVLQEGLGGIRDIILDGSQKIHTDAYRQSDASLRMAQANIQFISMGPRFVIEAFGMIVIAAFAYSLASRPGGFAAVVPVLGALAIGAQRVLPLLHQTYASLANVLGNLDYLSDALDLLDQSVQDDQKYLRKVAKVEFNRVIQLDKISFRYSPNEPYVLENLCISIPKGSRIGLIGATGSGKSTLVDILMGLLRPTNGALWVDDQTIVNDNGDAWKRRIAHVPQAIFLADATISENIAFGVPRGEIDHERVVLAAQQAQIAQNIEAWAEQYDTLVGERGVKLSGGQRQRIGIARALYKDADVIVFDEATSALDTQTEQAVIEAIDGLGDHLTIIMIAHRLTTLRNCSHIIELQNGRLKRVGNYADLINKFGQ